MDGDLQSAYAERLARLRIEVLDAFDCSRARIEGQLVDLMESVQQRLLDPSHHGRLGALASQSLQSIEDARLQTIRPGAKGLGRLEDRVTELVDAALVHGD